ncbi:hypothetical protein [Kineococcus rhizosphaerae]|uniref:hypothetical protein n=1 Tax=Kineococcus rhizosphaerae TaxID=559628 RepID=UPI000D06B456|nr:hypothetical protein [Kineococcus rhizosphaerae]
MTLIADLTRQAIVADLQRHKRTDIAVEVWSAGQQRAQVGRVNHVDEQLLVLADAHSSLITLVLDHIVGWTFASDAEAPKPAAAPARRSTRRFGHRR